MGIESTVRGIKNFGKKVSKNIHKKTLVYGLSAALAVAPFFGCGGGGGGGSGGSSAPKPKPAPVEDVSFATQDKTDSSGNVNFIYETGNADITTVDSYGDPAQGIEVGFWHKDNNDGKGFELYAAKDPEGKLAFPLFIMPHNSEWELMGAYLGDLPIVNTYFEGTDEFATAKKTLEAVLNGGTYSHQTLSELEGNLNKLSTGMIAGPDGKVISNYVAENFVSLVQSGKVPDLSEGTYMVFTGIPQSVSGGAIGVLNDILTVIPDFNMDGVPDWENSLPSPEPTCTDADGDGFFAESGCGTPVDCDDSFETGNGINPDAIEVYDGVDNNCNGEIDEGFSEPLPARLAYVSRESGPDQIWIMNSDRTKQQVTSVNGYAGSPSWIGNRVIFESNMDGINEGRNNPEEIYSSNPDGSNVRRLTNDDYFDTSPAGSPDGLEAAFLTSRWDGNLEVAKIKADGTGLERITNTSEDEYDLNWSRDGNYLLASRRIGSLDQIRVMDPNNGSDVIGIDSSYSDRRPAMSPDGTLAFDRLINGLRQIILYKDGVETQITNDNYNHFGTTWSPDGTMLVFFTDETGSWNLEQRNSDGSGKELLTNDFSTNYDPSFSH